MLCLGASAKSPATFPGEKTTWHGRDCYKFKFENRDAIVVVPDKPAEGNPWLWRPAFFDAFPAIDDALLNEGFYITYFNTTDEWGRPEAIEAGQKFYEMMVKDYGLMPRVVMNGLSRGGYYSLRRAETYPETVGCLILDNPLVDIFELRRNGQWWADVKNKLGFEPEIGEYTDNAAYNIHKIAQAKVPVLLLNGGQDTIVPYERNGAIVKACYRRYNAPFHSITRTKGGHHPHGLDSAAVVVPYIKDAIYNGAPQRGPLKIACLGNSITHGSGTSDAATKAYPAVLQRMLGDGYEVRNFGVPSATALRKGTESERQPFGYITLDACRQAAEWNPDIVIIKLGGNDSKPYNWKYKDDFAADYQEIIDRFKYLPSLPEIYVCLPAKARVADGSKIWGITEGTILHEITPQIKQIAHDNRLKAIDLHNAYLGEEAISYSDNIHPTDRGAELLARKIYQALIAE